jgi:hypothetical protein
MWRSKDWDIDAHRCFSRSQELRCPTYICQRAVIILADSEGLGVIQDGPVHMCLQLTPSEFSIVMTQMPTSPIDRPCAMLPREDSLRRDVDYFQEGMEVLLDPIICTVLRINEWLAFWLKVRVNRRT